MALCLDRDRRKFHLQPTQRPVDAGDLKRIFLERSTPGSRLYRGRQAFNLFGDWFEEAKARELDDSEAMALATAETNGLPDARMVLLKGWSESGFVFYTNAESAKGMQLAANMRPADCRWKSLRRQVRLRGPVTPTLDAEADAYSPRALATAASAPRLQHLGRSKPSGRRKPSPITP